MKHLYVLLPAMGLIASCASHGQAPPPAQPSYVSEAPLPEGWPKPGPYDQVTRKSLPAYRAAFAKAGGRGTSFWTLFLHIQKNNIPMTSPVEMSMTEKEQSLEMASMAFLYQNDKVGTTGASGAVEVKDVPKADVLSYTWQGTDSKENVAKAKTAIEVALADQKLTLGRYRLLGYNGPSTPRNKATWELQALLNP
ncbi:MAG: hypothetical protein RI957_907 [Verrucomicrobiota bacterium]|jgi:hypothetical protein